MIPFVLQIKAIVAKLSANIVLQINAIIAKLSVKNVIFFSVFFVISVRLLQKDALHFSIPVAFFIFISQMWNFSSNQLKQKLTSYKDQIEKEINNAKETLTAAENRLDIARKNQKELGKALESILQLAHQEAAHILIKTEKEIDTMQENQRRQLELENIVLRQKWKAAMAQELISAMKDHASYQAQANEKISGQRESIPGVISRKIISSFSKSSL